MSSTKRVIEDAEEVYNAWKEAPTGSYLENTLERSIAADIVPSLIHLLKERGEVKGFQKGNA